jgi:hypothetical protein
MSSPLFSLLLPSWAWMRAPEPPTGVQRPASHCSSSVGEVRSHCDAKGGVRIDDPTQLVCIRPAMEAFADDQPSLALLGRPERARHQLRGRMTLA